MRIRSIFLGIIIFVSLCVSGYAQQLEVLYFYSDTCGVCLSLRKDFLPTFKEKYQKDIQLNELNIYEKKNLEKLFAIAGKLGEEKPMVPAVVVRRKILIGRKAIETQLESIVQECLLSPDASSHEEATSVREVFSELSIAALIGAGLLDGINPCAFAVIVFFISFLSVYGYRRREVLCIGVFYILAVFLTYLLIGLGVFKFLYALKGFYRLVEIFYYAVSLACFLLGIFAVYDYILFLKKKNSGEQLLQLPLFLKKKINYIIGENLRHKQGGIIWLAGISFVIGLSVSLLEAVCTGQVYVPTIFFILKIPHLRVRALGYLILYNIIFILPLAVVFVLSFLGVSSGRFNDFLKKNLGLIKLFMAILFFALGTAILTLH